MDFTKRQIEETKKEFRTKTDTIRALNDAGEVKKNNIVELQQHLIIAKKLLEDI